MESNDLPLSTKIAVLDCMIDEVIAKQHVLFLAMYGLEKFVQMELKDETLCDWMFSGVHQAVTEISSDLSEMKQRLAKFRQ